MKWAKYYVLHFKDNLVHEVLVPPIIYRLESLNVRYPQNNPSAVTRSALKMFNMTRNHYKSLGRTKIKSGFLKDFPLRLQHRVLGILSIYWCAVLYCPIYPIFPKTSNMIPVYWRKEQVHIHKNTTKKESIIHT